MLSCPCPSIQHIWSRGIQLVINESKDILIMNNSCNKYRKK